MSDEQPQFFAPLGAWTWQGVVYEQDRSGLALHRSECALENDTDCDCGAHTVNMHIANGNWRHWQSKKD